jgi:hypothetical protein
MRFGSVFFSLALLALLAMAPESALAAPELGVAINRSAEVMPRNSEQLTYGISVKNDATAAPVPGAQLSCKREAWINEAGFTYSFSYQWLRDGVRLESLEDIAHGSQTSTYTVQTADEGRALQCLVTGENPNTVNSNDSTGGHPTAFTTASQQVIVTEPAPTEPPPLRISTGSDSRAQISGSVAHAGDELTCAAPNSFWSTIAQASTSVGSKMLTNVTTAKSESNVSVHVGSKLVTFEAGINPTPIFTGRFTVGQTVVFNSPVKAPAGTTITNVSGNTLTLSEPVESVGANGNGKTIMAGSLPLKAGQAISGPGIPAGVTIVAVSGRSVEISAPAEATASNVALTDAEAGIGIWSFEWLLNGVPRSGAPGQGEVTTTGTTSKLKVAASEVEQPGAFECLAYATNEGGTAAVSSRPVYTEAPAPVIPAGTTPNQASLVAPQIELAAVTSGSVQLHVELPGGEETRIFEVSAKGWTCTVQEPEGAVHAGLDCERADVLAPQAEYPQVSVATILGADAPEPAIARAEVFGGGSDPASAEDVLNWSPPVPFGIRSLTTSVLGENGADYTQAGGHPISAGVAVALNTRVSRDGRQAQVKFLRQIRTDTPPGFIANPQAAPRECATIEEVLSDRYSNPTCPRESIVGGVDINTDQTNQLTGLPLYLLHPEPGVPAQLVFAVPGIPVSYSLTPRLRADEGYAISVDTAPIAKAPVIFSAAVKLCGYGAVVGPSGAAGLTLGAPQVTGCRKPGEPGANRTPFMTNPTRCSGAPPVTKMSVDSWDEPGAFASAEALSPLVTGCDEVPFIPSVSLAPTSHEADSPTGLDVSISVPTAGLESPAGIAQSDLKQAVVTLPKGMAVNPAAADGLGACSSAQISLGTNEAVQCPESSKIGSAEIKTPLLEQPLKGSVYLAKQGDNPFHSLLAIYLVVESKERGILVKVPGHVEPQPDGQLVANFDDNPQVPFSSLTLHFNSGNRAPLLNPPACGSYGIESTLYPWSAPTQAHTITSTFQVTSGPGGGPCPSGELAPKLNAGVVNPVAGATSPFVVQLTREDGSQRFAGLDLTLPPGLTAYLKGIPYCPDSALAAVSGAEGAGQQEIEHPSCPSASQIGTVSVGAGGGSNPYYVTSGKAYLAGPYKGAPLSIAVVAPAVAGPFDLGSVVVRSAAYVNESTAQITVKSDPIPTILHGIPLDIRDIRVNVDRPSFMLAPTNCEEMSVAAAVAGEGGATANAANRFQVGECSSLGFQPNLKLSFKGGTRRTRHPALQSALTFPSSGRFANTARAVVTLPHSEIIDPEHVGNPCTRPQFAEEKCPKISILGRAKAWTPLLDEPLEGKVYFRSNGGERELPDIVADLNGQIHVVLIGAVDTASPKTNARIRTTFFQVPDAPVSKFQLELKGGKEGLLVNSQNLCRSSQRAAVTFTAQNGAVRKTQPKIANQCGSGKGP